jgi:two-component system, OmpR family, phosphate regulon response regulator OmpR
MSGRNLEDDASHLLIVDDDRRIRDLLSRFLKERGYRVTTAENAAGARTALQSFDFDLIVLDVMMPGESGLDLARAIRAGGETPILILSARSELDDRLTGLAIGIDDYLGKPFEPQELLLRIANILRRAAAAPAQAARTAPETARFGPFQFHLERGELRRADEPIRLTDRERDLLRALAEAPQGALSREALSELHSGANDRTIDVHINRLRRKIEDDPGNPRYLQTVRGMGYRLFLDNG